MRLDCRDAAGPVWARHLSHSLHRGEDFILQIDSHMRFVNGWDDVLLTQLARCPAHKPIISTYPAGYTLPDNVPAIKDTPIPVMCATKFGPEGLPRFTGAKIK